jgi:hypothetical protein
MVSESLTAPEVITVLCELLRTGGNYPILINEAIIALALIATFGTEIASMLASGQADYRDERNFGDENDQRR